MEFDYNACVTTLNTIDIVDIGDCAIEVKNDDNMFFYLLIRTTRGKSSITTFGPVVPDLKLLPNNFTLSHKRIDFDINKVKKEIKTFLLNPKRKITEAKEVTAQDVIESCPNFKEYLTNYGIGGVY